MKHAQGPVDECIGLLFAVENARRLLPIADISLLSPFGECVGDSAIRDKTEQPADVSDVL